MMTIPLKWKERDDGLPGRQGSDTAWIESHQSLARHRKTLKAAALLKVDRHKLIGHLHELWWWALDNADIQGLLPECSNSEIAEAAGWPAKDGERFVRALETAGFIDRDVDTHAISLHDWYEFAGKLNQRRAENRERMRAKRDQPEPPPDPRTNAARAEHVQRTKAPRAPATVHNRTGPNRTEENRNPPTADAVGPPCVEFSDSEQRVIDEVTSTLGPFQFGLVPGLWRKVFDEFGVLSLPIEAYKQADWLRRKHIRTCSAPRYTNWLDKALADRHTRAPDDVEASDDIPDEPPFTPWCCAAARFSDGVEHAKSCRSQATAKGA